MQWFLVIELHDTSTFISLFQSIAALWRFICSAKNFSPSWSLSEWKPSSPPPQKRKKKKKNYGKSGKLFRMELIRGNLCLLNIYRGFVILSIILSHVISRWCLQSSISLQDTLGVIASLSDNWPSLSLCMWKGKKLVALEASPRAQECTPNTICRGDSLIWLMFLWSFIETAV